MERDLTKGSVPGNIARFALPFLFSYFLQILYGLADLYIVGQFCDTASITAVSIGSQLMHMLTVMLVGLAMGATVAIGKAYGAQDRAAVSLTIGNTVTLFAAVSAAATVLLLALVRPIATVMSTPAEAFSGTVTYLTICFIGVPFITAYNVLSSMFRGLGDTKSPMYFIIVACVCNIVLDYIFIGGLGLGPAGAALGTALSQAVSVLAALIMIRRRSTGISIPQGDLKPQQRIGIYMSRGDLRPDRRTVSAILRVGVPVAIQDGFIQISFLVITIFANRRGLNDAAAVGIVEKIIGILFLIPSTMLSAVSALAAQNIGARRPDRARQTLYWACGIAIGFGLIASVITQFIAPQMVGLFDDSADVVRLGGQYLSSYVWDCIFAGIHFSCSGYFAAIERSGLSFLHNALSIVLMRIPLAYFASVRFPDTLFPMGIAAPAGSLLSVIICVIALRILRKKEAAGAA